jgi:GNAT superfamily N-acetyltransferase
MNILETCTGANGKQFKIVRYDESIRKDLELFCEKAGEAGYNNNSSLQALHMGRWGDNEAWWVVYHNNDIVHMAGTQYLPHVHKDCYMVLKRIATLPEYSGQACDGVSRKMLNCFGNTWLLPHQVDWCLRRGAKEMIISVNSPVNGVDPSGTMHKLWKSAKTFWPRVGYSLEYPDFVLYNAVQDLWRVNVRDIRTQEEIKYV